MFPQVDMYIFLNEKKSERFKWIIENESLIFTLFDSLALCLFTKNNNFLNGYVVSFAEFMIKELSFLRTQFKLGK